MNGFGHIKDYKDWSKLPQDQRDFAMFMAIDRLGGRINRVERIVYGGVAIILVAFISSLTGIWK